MALNKKFDEDWAHDIAVDAKSTGAITNLDVINQSLD